MIASTAIAEGLALYTTNPGDHAGLDSLLPSWASRGRQSRTNTAASHPNPRSCRQPSAGTPGGRFDTRPQEGDASTLPMAALAAHYAARLAGRRGVPLADLDTALDQVDADDGQ